MAQRKKKISQKEIQQMQQDYIDFWSRCITESIFWLVPYILLFLILGFIFK